MLDTDRLAVFYRLARSQSGQTQADGTQADGGDGVNNPFGVQLDLRWGLWGWGGDAFPC